MIRRSVRAGERTVGNESEKSADLALSWLQDHEIIRTWWNSSWRQDRYEGIDRVIQPIEGGEKYLQIKSSYAGLEKARAHHPEVPCIIVEPQWNTEQLALRIQGVLKINHSNITS